MIEMEIRRFGELQYQAVEALNTLCTNLSFTGGNIRVVMVTSCYQGEGKSFVTMNLLRSMAQLGMRVVLVDADLRASALQENYDIQIGGAFDQRYKGLTGYLAGQCEMDSIIGKTNIPGAHLILAGKTVKNALPLFNTSAMGDLLGELKKTFDLVVVDAPPIGTVIDAAKIGEVCDGTLFVVESGRITAEKLKESVAQIEKAGCPVMGYVVNKLDEKKYGERDKYENYYYAGGKRRKRR